MSQAAQNCVVSSIAQNDEAWRIQLCFRVTLRMATKMVPVYRVNLKLADNQAKNNRESFERQSLGSYNDVVTTTEFNNNILPHQLYDFNTTSFRDTLGCFISLAQEDSALIPN